MANTSKFKKLFFAGTLASVLSACTTLPPPAPTASPSERQAFLLSRVEHVLTHQQRADAPGVAVLVVKDGQPILARGKGMADISAGRGIDVNTVFDVGSITKPITAIAVMQLADSGRLALGDQIGKWLPELSQEWGAATIHHLLSHQSGLPDPMQVSLAEFRQLDGLSNHALIQRHRGEQLRFAPGSKAEYNNYNYVLLAEIIARASGQTYAAYVKQWIFDPAGMHASYVRDQAPPVMAPVALNYGRNKRTHGITLATVGETGVWSSAADLGRLIDSLLAGRLVSQQTLGNTTRPQSTYQVGTEAYGYGFFVQPGAAPLTLFAHTGEVDGYRSYLRVDLRKGVYYVVLSNGGKTNAPVVNNLVASIQDAYERD